MSQRCIFYVRTSDGERCVMIPPDDWKMSREGFIKMCLNGGKGCPILARYELTKGTKVP